MERFNISMKAVQITAPNQAHIAEVPVPALKPGHALVRPICLSLCASDIYSLRYAPATSYPRLPGCSGHEMVGVVEALAGDHPHVKEGDLALTIAPEQAAMAEYYLAPFKNVLPVPEDVPPEHLVQAQQLGTVIYSCKQLPNLIGKDVAVIGQGTAGLWFDVMLKRLGAKRIIGVDLQAHRLAVSKFYGATDTVHNSRVDAVSAVKELLDGKQPDVVIEAAGEIASINLAIDLVRDSGFLLQFGVPHERRFVVNYGQLFRKCLNLKANVNAWSEPGHTSTLAAIDMIAKSEVDVRPILTHRFPFERVLEAYDLQDTRDEGNIKIIIEMPAKSGPYDSSA